MKFNSKSILVGMSGGVDSSTACFLLREQGYDIQGVTLWMCDAPRNHEKYHDEFPDYIVEARNLARRIGFPHHVIDVRDEFKRAVMDVFAHEYLNGRTPNPCVLCNASMKWTKMAELADRLQCAYIATGHYAKLSEFDGKRYVSRGSDGLKDQSYFLWNVPTDLWNRVVLPLGELSKSDVKRIAEENGFVSLSQKKESMEVCFVEDDYRTFLRQSYPELTEAIGRGHFVNPAGDKLGEHDGYPFYTVGQRKGLRIALGEPAYVLKINPLKNTVMLGDRSMLETREIVVENYSLVDPKDLDLPVQTQIRYRSQPTSSRVRVVNENLLIVSFDEPVYAAAPGQSAAFYQGDRVLGGGFIGDAKLLKKARKMCEVKNG